MSHLYLFIMFCPAVIFLLQAVRVSALSRRGFYSGCFVILCTQSRCLRNQTSQRAVGRNWWRSGPGTAAWFLEIIHLHLTVFLLSTKQTDAICSWLTRQSLLLFWKFSHCQAASPGLSLWILSNQLLYQRGSDIQLHCFWIAAGTASPCSSLRSTAPL